MKETEQREFAAAPVEVMLATADAHLRMVVAQELAADRRVALIAQPKSVAEARWRMSQEPVDVLLADVRLDHVLELLDLRCPLKRKPEVLVICANDDDAAAVEAFNAGASGCVARNAWFGRFVQAVLEVASGGAVLPPSLARRLLQERDLPAPRAAPRKVSTAGAAPVIRLSRRETEVLAMVASGLRTREIGQQLTISGDTVNAHIRSIYGKLQVRSRAQAVRIATQAGLL